MKVKPKVVLPIHLLYSILDYTRLYSLMLVLDSFICRDKGVSNYSHTMTKIQDYLSSSLIRNAKLFTGVEENFKTNYDKKV